jgi:hypothetical protein
MFEEVHMEEEPSKLAVRDAVEANVLLSGDDTSDVVVFYLAKVVGGD